MALILISDYTGRLGNRLFLQIHVMAAAASHGWRLCNLALLPHAAWLQGTANNSLCLFPAPKLGLGLHSFVRPLRGLLEKGVAWHQRFPGLRIPGFRVFRASGPALLNLDSQEFQKAVAAPGLLALWGFRFRNNRHVVEQRGRVAPYLLPRSGWHPGLTKALEKKARKGEFWLCLHIRQGDYRTWRDGAFYLPPEVFARHAWEVFQGNPGKKLRFWVCSDEPVDLSLFPPGTERTGGSLREDLFIMTRADALLLGKSTLGLVAAYLAGARFWCLLDSVPPRDLESWKDGAWAVQDPALPDDSAESGRQG